MLDTHAIARALTAADFTPAQADALTDAVRQAAEHDAAGIDVETLATKEDLRAEIAVIEGSMKALEGSMKTDLAALDMPEAALMRGSAARPLRRRVPRSARREPPAPPDRTRPASARREPAPRCGCAP